MDKDVIVHINGMQFADTGGGNEEPVEVIAPGKYYFKKGLHYLLIDEVDDMLNETSKSIIKFSKSYMEVNRHGSINSHMIFEENKKIKSIYTTPFGSMNIGIATTRIDLKEKENLIELTANYSLEINDDYVADCKISLKAEPKTNRLTLTS